MLEESRLGKGAEDRMFRKIYPHLFAGSIICKQASDRSRQHIKNASYDVVRKFYKDWYRPDLMAVIVVGDIDPAKAEGLVKKYFDRLKNPANQRLRITPGVPPYIKTMQKW